MTLLESNRFVLGPRDGLVPAVCVGAAFVHGGRNAASAKRVTFPAEPAVACEVSSCGGTVSDPGGCFLREREWEWRYGPGLFPFSDPGVLGRIWSRPELVHAQKDGR